MPSKKRVRARRKDGRYKGDDPKTEVNEAYVNEAYQKFHDSVSKNISSTEIFSTKIPDEFTHRFVIGGCLFLIFCICLAFLI